MNPVPIDPIHGARCRNKHERIWNGIGSFFGSGLRDERGSILLGGLVLALVMTLLGFALFDLTVLESRLVIDRHTQTQACNTSEAALNRLWQEMGNGDGKNDFAQVFARADGDGVFTDAEFDTKNNGTYKYTVTKLESLINPSRVRVRATGTSPPAVTSPNGVQCLIEAVFSRQFGLPFALFGTEEVEIKGSPTLIDSYDSSKGPYDPKTAGSNGDVRSNGEIEIEGGATVKGDVTAGETVEIEGKKNVTGTITEHASPLFLEPNPVTACGPPFSSGSGITGSFTYKDGELKITGGGKATLANGTYCFKSISLSGGSTLVVNGPVVVFLTDKSDLTGGAVVNTTEKAQNLLFLSSATGPQGEIKVSGGSQAYMVVYAPATEIKFSGGSELFGAFVGGSIQVSGSPKVHFDEALSNANLIAGIVVLRRDLWALVQN